MIIVGLHGESFDIDTAKLCPQLSECEVRDVVSWNVFDCAPRHEIEKTLSHLKVYATPAEFCAAKGLEYTDDASFEEEHGDNPYILTLGSTARIAEIC